MNIPLFAKNNQLIESSLPPLSSSLFTSKVVFNSKIHTIHTLFSITLYTLVQAMIISQLDEIQQLTNWPPAALLTHSHTICSLDRKVIF